MSCILNQKFPPDLVSVPVGYRPHGSFSAIRLSLMPLDQTDRWFNTVNEIVIKLLKSV